ncbi:suppressor of fused domain protein [Actinoplanes sp. NPDC049802]|uniref:suppressor of fused domain protein n=1 Tax=Actinoplanes sp. NPDC049802 TaxID=3154742 RepID=UPI0033FC385F
MRWEAVTEAMGRLYPLEQPWHVSYPVEGCHVRAASAYPAAGHWHVVSYGLGERFGFELTVRVARGAEVRPPQWPFVLLDRVAAYVATLDGVVEDGQWIDWGAPVTGFPYTDGPDTGLTVLILVPDPQLGERFLQLVGVTAAEADGSVEIAEDPLMVTDPLRA